MNLTKPQQLIYTTEKFSGGAITTICGSILLDNYVSPDKVCKAVNAMYENNDALRIRIQETDGITTQKVIEYLPQEISLLYFSTMGDFENYANIKAKEPMDIYGDLCDISCVFAEGKVGILAKVHHIISDAWTLSLIGSQLVSYVNDVEIEAGTYLDYIDTEKTYLNSIRYQRDRETWIEKFSKCNEPTLLTEKISKTTTANRKTFVVDEENTKIISSFLKSMGASMYLVLMTTVAIYFNRIKNNVEKFYIGTAVLNRSGYDEKSTMGMYINTVPILIELDNNKDFIENMESIKKASLSAFRHQRFNYGDILKTIREEFGFEDKLYDILFSYQNAKVAGENFQSQWYHCGQQNESLQIHVDDRDSEGILKIHYDYQVEKFSEDEITSIHKHIFNLLFATIKDYNAENEE